MFTPEVAIYNFCQTPLKIVLEGHRCEGWLIESRNFTVSIELEFLGLFSVYICWSQSLSVFSHNISTMVLDLTILIPPIALKLVLSKLIALRLAISKSAVTSPWIYHILPTSNICLIKSKSKCYLVRIIFHPKLQRYKNNQSIS